MKGNRMSGAYVFDTRRMRVRRWRASDQADLLGLYSDPDVIRWVDDGQALTPAEADAWMQVTQTNYETRGYGMFAIEDRENALTIGFGGIIHPGGQPDPEIKYAFYPHMWGRGLATEFVRGLLAYGIKAHKLQGFIATIAPQNTASRHVVLKAGLHQIQSRTEEDKSQTDVFVWPTPSN